MEVKFGEVEVKEEDDAIVLKLINGEEVEVGALGYINIKDKDGKVKLYLEW